MVLSGIARLKFAVRDKGIYHEKFGIFEDELGLKVAFIGSANETHAALSLGENHESFAVFQSIEPELYAAYGSDLERRFEKLWLGQTNNTRIYDLDDESLKIIQEIAHRQVAGGEQEEPGKLQPLPEKYVLREYQNEAIRAWQTQRFRGILAMATGTGKTLTAIDAIKRVRSKVQGGAVVITVPYQNLAMQWINGLRDQSIDTIPVFGGYLNWYSQVKNIFMAAQYSDAVTLPCLVCVNTTFKDERFQELLELLKTSKQTSHFIIVDECHHFNDSKQVKMLPEHFRLRLGLSATPYDQFEGHFLESYFGQIAYEFSLGRAIVEGFLTPYNFHVIACELDEDETQEYEKLTRTIVRLAGSEESFSPEIFAKVQPYLLARARIVGAAKDKLQKLNDHLKQVGKTPYSLFYCGDGSIDEAGGERHRQIEAVLSLLHGLGWRCSQITANESLKTREELLERLRTKSIDAVVSIKVLDEGIDVPACQRAYLLASQSSDRQGIQRRGRVLRKSPGKEKAELFDFIVLGGTSNTRTFKNLAAREIRRAYQFARESDNGAVIAHELKRIQKKLGLDAGDPNVQQK